MFLSAYEKTLLNKTISMEIDTIKSILVDNSSTGKLPQESIAHFENGLYILSNVLQHIDNYYIVEFDEEQSYHIRYAIALHLRTLMDALRSDELMTDEIYEVFSDAVNTLLILYKRLQ